jgi:hypothetical protein
VTEDPYHRPVRCNVRDCGQLVDDSSPTRCTKHIGARTCTRRIRAIGRRRTDLCNREVVDDGLCRRHLAQHRAAQARIRDTHAGLTKGTEGEKGDDQI